MSFHNMPTYNCVINKPTRIINRSCSKTSHILRKKPIKCVGRVIVVMNAPAAKPAPIIIF